MDIPTRNLAKYIREKGLNVPKLSKATGISYGALYDSLLNSERDRDLRLGEALSICAFLELDPREFAEQRQE